MSGEPANVDDVFVRGPVVALDACYERSVARVFHCRSDRFFYPGGLIYQHIASAGAKHRKLPQWLLR
jgi:hypothetical protein